MGLLAYHSDPKIKAKYLKRVRSHMKADEIIKGVYWKDGKGCAVGCTIHSSSHQDYEIQLGIPSSLAKLEDGIFEGLPNKQAKIWPELFLKSIKPGADLSNVIPKFMVWLLQDVIKYAKPAGKAAIQTVIDLYIRKLSGEPIGVVDWCAARNAAYAAYADAYAYAAAYAAYAAAYAAGAYAAGAYAADAAAYASDAASAAYAADAAAAAYAASAAYADAASAAYADARKKARERHRVKQSKKLIELLKGCK